MYHMYSNIYVSSSTLIPIDRKVRGQFLYFMTDLGKSDSDCHDLPMERAIWTPVACLKGEGGTGVRRSARNFVPEAFILGCHFPEA